MHPAGRIARLMQLCRFSGSLDSVYEGKKIFLLIFFKELAIFLNSSPMHVSGSQTSWFWTHLEIPAGTVFWQGWDALPAGS